MEKGLQQHMFYKGVSALESGLLSRVSAAGLVAFGVADAQRVSGLGRTSVHNILSALAGKKILLKILRNRYCLKENVFENEFAVATAVFIPSYVSFWSALSFYGFTEQQVKTVQLAAPKQFKRIELEEISIQPITIKPKNFFGYVNENGFVIASKEKALIDAGLDFENAGGFSEFAKCLKNAWGEINKKIFVKFLLRINNKSFNSRVGYIIEEAMLPIEKSLLERIHSKRSKGFVKLNPAKNHGINTIVSSGRNKHRSHLPLESRSVQRYGSSAKGSLSKYNNRWNVIVNDSIEETGIL